MEIQGNNKNKPYTKADLKAEYEKGIKKGEREPKWTECENYYENKSFAVVLKHSLLGNLTIGIYHLNDFYANGKIIDRTLYKFIRLPK